MRTVPSRSMLRSVSDQVVHIAIDVTFGDDQIRGHVSDGVREPRSFLGWLGLIGALDSMMGSEDRDDVAPAVGAADSVRGMQPGGKR